MAYSFDVLTFFVPSVTRVMSLSNPKFLRLSDFDQLEGTGVTAWTDRQTDGYNVLCGSREGRIIILSVWNTTSVDRPNIYRWQLPGFDVAINVNDNISKMLNWAFENNMKTPGGIIAWIQITCYGNYAVQYSRRAVLAYAFAELISL